MVPQLLMDDLIETLREEGQHYVDSRTWQDDWSDAWAGYSDVLGFGERCLQSEPTTVNTIVRFHRCVASAMVAC